MYIPVIPMAVALGAVIALSVVPFVLTFARLDFLVGVAVPYAAFLVFVGGFVYRIVEWAKSPVPFRIPTTCGQQESLPWFKQNKFDNPSTTFGVVVRMLLEVFAFRSLFRNTKADVLEGPKLVYGSSKWLWMAGLAFHWAFLIIFMRHFRLFIDPVPAFVHLMEWGDGFLQITLPTFYITDAVIVGAATFLFFRRVVVPQVRYISNAADFFPLFLILAIALSGMLMRYVVKVDITAVKSLIHGLFTLHPVVPDSVGFVFYIHIFLVSSLMAYFPFSKLVHMGGVFMSPTRNLANTSRMERHINPWNPNIKFHTYEEYENDFRSAMKGVGLPLEKDEEETK